MAPTFISFHIGIGTYDTQIYPTAGPLKSPPDDAAAMAGLAKGLGYTVTPPLLNGAAKYQAVVDLFRGAAAALTGGGGRCLISFSGHGTAFDNGRSDPKPAICLADATMSNDVIAGLISEFPPNAFVTFIKDCCHGASTGGIFPPPPEHWFIDRIRRILAPGWLPSRIRLGCPKVNGKPTAVPPKVAVDLEKKYADFDRTNIQAKGAAFQACANDQLTFDGANSGDLGIYTQKVVDAVKGATTIGELRVALRTVKPHIPRCDPQFAGQPNEVSVLGETLQCSP